MAVPAAIAKAAAMLLTNEKTRKGVGWILVAVFSPVILLIALLCAIGSLCGETPQSDRACTQRNWQVLCIWPCE